MADKITFKVEGIREFENLIKEMQDDFGEKDQKKILNKAVKKSMGSVLNAAKVRAPVDTGALQASLRLEVRKPSRKDKRSKYVMPTDIVIGNVTTAPGNVLAKGLKLYDYEASYKAKKDIYKKQSVKSDARVIANEFGTAKMGAKPFLRPAMESQAGSVVNSLADSLGSVLTKYRSKKV